MIQSSDSQKVSKVRKYFCQKICQKIRQNIRQKIRQKVRLFFLSKTIKFALQLEHPYDSIIRFAKSSKVRKYFLTALLCKYFKEN
jgi:hypothetical protein